MQFIDFKTLLYSDTLVPDIFINEYLPALKSEYVKIYLYCLFLVGKNQNPSIQDLALQLDIPLETVKKGLHFMDNLNILSWTEEGILIKDLKEIEINKFYRPKSTSLPEEAAESSKLSIRRRQVIEAINNEFFSSVMAISWYGDIDLWFGQYGFDEDVMYMLFRHCRDNGGLRKTYITKVAENMYTKGVKNSFDFERYVREYEELKAVSGQIQKKLKLRRRVDEYQMEYVDKWINKYGYSFDIIELALRKTANRPDAAFPYFDSILTGWYNLKLDTVEKIQSHEERYKNDNAAGYKRAGSGVPIGKVSRGSRRDATSHGGAESGASTRGGFKQREYDDAELEQFVTSDFDAIGAPEEKYDGKAVKSGGNTSKSKRVPADRSDS